MLEGFSYISLGRAFAYNISLKWFIDYSVVVIINILVI